MKFDWIMRTISVTLVSSTAVVGQVVRFDVPLYVTDGIERDTLYFGIIPNGNFCVVDTDCVNGRCEFFLPPPPPQGVFDSRFVWPRAGSNLVCFDQGTWFDYRPFISATQRDTFRVRHQMSDNATVKILSWPADLPERFTGLTLRYFDQDSGRNINVNMLQVTSANITGAGDPAIANIFSAGLVLPPAPPQPPSLIAPPNAAVNVSLLPTLRWNRAAGATSHHFQVATDSLFTQLVAEDSLLTDTVRTVGPLNRNTRYYWHVRGRNISGYGLYSSTFMFTTIDTPPAPSPISPPDGAMNVSVTPTLTWSSVATAATYRLQVALDSQFTQIVRDDSTLTGTSRQITPPLNTGTLYFWHVRAQNEAGASPYSSAFRFTTTTAPPAPMLISPPDSATVVPLPVRFIWSRVASATSYHLQVATSAAFTTIVFQDSAITDSTRSVASLSWSARLYWRVRSRNASGASEFTAPWVFTVMMPAPSAPALVYPPDGQTNMPLDTIFRWRHVNLGEGYHIQIAHDDLFTNIFFQDSTLTDTTRRVRLCPSRSYYWRVRARNVEYTWGPWSFTRGFITVNGPPAVPIALYPLNGDTGVVRDVTFRWEGSPCALTYRVQVSLNIGFIPPLVADDSTVTGTEFFAGILAAGTSYHWRVRAKGTFVNPSAWTSVQSFRTGTTIVNVGEGQNAQVPTAFVLHPPYPNPFNPSTRIRFEVPDGGFVSLKVYDILGREVATLVNEHLPPGIYERTFSARGGSGYDAEAGNLPSGIYLVRMNAVLLQDKHLFTATRKMMLMK